MSLTVTLYVDGACRGNPGPGGIGVVVASSVGDVLKQIGEAVGEVTPHQADYLALIRGLEEASTMGASKVTVYSDSELLVRQMKGQVRVTDDLVRNLHHRAWSLAAPLHLQMILVPRGRNRQADSLARRVLEQPQAAVDEGPAPPPPPYIHWRRDRRRAPRPPTATDGTPRREDVQVSSGGVVYRRAGGNYEVCLIAKKGGKVWALPKGRVNPGETPEDTAVREVLEETGHRARIESKLDEISYFFFWKENNTLYHKTVTFFLMPLEEADAAPRDDEADDVQWFSLTDAYKRLTYNNEKDVVKAAREVLLDS